MSRSDGGGRAASGLFYQYLFTIERFLDLLDAGSDLDMAVLIEDPQMQQVTDPDVVDFAVRSRGSTLLEIHQAKSAADPDTTTISAAEAISVLTRMTKAIDCPHYVLTTNARAGRTLNVLTTVLDNARAATPTDDATFLAQLDALCLRSADASAKLAEIDSPAALARLRRAQVRATGEVSSRMRGRIRIRLSRWRAEHGLALSERAAGLLENSLITTMFEHAAGTPYSPCLHSPTGGRAVTLREFTEMLATSTHLLSQTAGVDDSGAGIHRVPAGEGIDRPELLAELTARLSNVRGRRVARCALVGRSGIGKTRLTAMYAHANREGYDRVCWIDAESDASMLASIVAQRMLLGLLGVESAPPQEVPQLFRQSVSKFIGRWLIVFDNAPHPDLIRAWLPTAGAAQVIVTSTNSQAWTAFAPLPVRGMSEPQAIELLADRLGTPGDVTAEAAQALQTIARKFEGWPLALQIVAAHFGELPALIRGSASYLNQIADYVIDDESLDRDGYPRTLQAAIGICLDRLASAASEDDGALVGDAMLNAGSVVAGQAIPEELLYVAACVDDEILREGAMVAVDPDGGYAMLDRAMGRVRAESLLDRSENLSPAPAELRSMIEINEVVQRIVRARQTSLGALVPVLNRVAAHLSSWLAYYTRRYDYSAAIMLQAHAQAVLDHVSQSSAARTEFSKAGPLAGNLALLLNIRGMTGAGALQWVNLQREILAALPSSPHRALAKSAHTMLDSLRALGSGDPTLLAYACEIVTQLETAAQCGDTDWEAEPIRRNVWSWVGTSVEKARFYGHDTTTLEMLHHRIAALADRFPPNGAAALQQASDEINAALSNSDGDGALDLIDTAMQMIDHGDHRSRLLMAAYRVEALSMLRRFSDLAAHLDLLHAELDDHPETRSGLAQILLDAANHLWHRGLLFGESPVADPLVEQIVQLTATLLVSDYDRCRHALLSAYLACLAEDRTGARSILEYARTIRPHELPSEVIASPVIDALDSWLQHLIDSPNMAARPQVIIGKPTRISHFTDSPIGSLRSIHVRPHDGSLPDLGSPPHQATWRRDSWLGFVYVLELRNVTNELAALLLLDIDDDVLDVDGNRIDIAQFVNGCNGVVVELDTAPADQFIYALVLTPRQSHPNR
ncbi:hypothetical protein ACFXHA_39110 [Nocardia sp. NPDC059240]|uniref:hypothetical protein n=1 Tax=Nocardia sp. NPDC059240 TaxID=3346786 RepID=UPI003691D7D7